MIAHSNTEDEVLIGNKRKRVVLPDLLDCLNDELGWDRHMVWLRVQAIRVMGHPDASVIYAMFREGVVTEWVYHKVRRVYRTELAARHASTDSDLHIDPKKVPMIEHLDTWPSESMRRRYYRRKRAEEKRLQELAHRRGRRDARNRKSRPRRRDGRRERQREV